MINLKEMTTVKKQNQNKDSPEESPRMPWSRKPGQISSTDHFPITVMAVAPRAHRMGTELPLPLACHSLNQVSSTLASKAETLKLLGERENQGRVQAAIAQEGEKTTESACYSLAPPLEGPGMHNSVRGTAATYKTGWEEVTCSFPNNFCNVLS